MKRISRLGWLALAMSVSAGDLAAQSLFATRGLGLPVAPVDARARALGGIGIGLAGLSTSLTNPAEVAGLTRSGVTAALQPTSGTVRFGGDEDDLGGARFPLARILFPLNSRLVATVGYGGVMEQSFGIRTEGTTVVGGESLAVIDEVQSNGGLSEVGLGLAWAPFSSLAIGVSGGLYAGNQRRSVLRTFPDSLRDLEDFREEFSWEYRAPFVRAGVRWDPFSLLRVGAAMTLASDLDIDGANDRSADTKATIPTRISLGASGFLSPELLLAVGAERMLHGNGRVFEDDAASALARDTWRVGGGVEFGGIGSGARTWPIRLGASWAQLPYHGADEMPAEEFAWSGGIGFRLAGDPSDPAAVLDATLERGNRSGLESSPNPDGLEERFWRFTVSLSLFGR